MYRSFFVQLPPLACPGADESMKFNQRGHIEGLLFAHGIS